MTDTTLDFVVEPEDQGDPESAWQTPSWHAVVFPNDEGVLHHGSRGARLPDTVVVRLGDRAVALADIFSHVLDNQYCWDAEYYLVLRVREVLLPDVWAALPWAALGPGDVFYAWDKFHGIDYSRAADDASSMSYGGDWSDLQAYIDREHPRPEGPRPLASVSDATLLRAVRARDVAQVRALLAAGADANAGYDAPGAALRAVSVDRDTTALWEAVTDGSTEIVEALLRAGAIVDGFGVVGPLWAALRGRRLDVAAVLLRHGADPNRQHDGRTMREMAAELGPEALALFEPPVPLQADYDDGYFDKDEQGWCARRVELRRDGARVTIRRSGDDNGLRPYDDTVEARIGPSWTDLGLTKLLTPHVAHYFDHRTGRLRGGGEQINHCVVPPADYYTNPSGLADALALLVPVAHGLGLDPGPTPQGFTMPPLTPSPTAEGARESTLRLGGAPGCHWELVLREFPAGYWLGPQLSAAVVGRGVHVSLFVQSPERAHFLFIGPLELHHHAFAARDRVLAAWCAPPAG